MARRRSQSIKRALVLGIIAVAFGVALMVGLSYAVGTGKVDGSNLGDHQFRVGRADQLAERIQKDKRPRLFADASPDHDLDIYVQHIGASPTKGWIAISAGPRKCSLQWDESDLEFVDPCTGATHPPDGSDLTRFRTSVENNAVYVDLGKKLK